MDPESAKGDSSLARAGYRRCRPTLFMLAIVALILAAACNVGADVTGSGRSASEERQVSEFREVEVDGALNVTIESGATRRVTVTADSNIVPIITTEVRNNRLSIGTTKSYRSKAQPATVTVVTPDLTAVRASGSTDVSITNLRADRLSINADGSADVSASGSVGQLDLEASGSADLNLSELEARQVTIQASGSADAEVNAVETISGSLSGSADLSYRGSPTVSVRTSGSADINRR